MTKIYSLCLTTENLNNRENKILYRIADLNGEELEKYVSYADVLQDEFDNNSRHPRTYRENYELNNLRIWEWDPSSKTYATKASIPFYELINCYDIATLGEERIIDALKEGVKIQLYNNKKTLLVIGEDKDDYKVIEIDSNNVISRDGISKIKTNFNGYINGFYLNKEDFLNTENVVVYSSEGKRLPPRIVYKYLKLPYPDFKLDTLDIKDKLELFINKEIKLNQSFTRIQKREVRSIFNEILKDYKIIENYFEESGFNEENLEEKIRNISSIINNVLSDDNKWDRFSEAMIENIPTLNKKFTKIANDRFVENNKEKIEKLNSVIKDKEQIIEGLSKKSEQCKDTIVKLIKERDNIENNIIDNNKTLKNLDIALKNKVEEIKSDMAAFVSEISLMELLGGGSVNHLNSSFFRENSTSIQDDIEVILDKNEFASILSINLEIAGIAKDNIDAVSKYITGTLIQKNSLYLVGTYSNHIADSISATYCGLKADVISVTNPSIDVDSILKKIYKCSSSVVVIENLLNLNEMVALLLSKIVKDKILIFSSDITETLNFIPQSILNSLNVLCLDYVCDKPLNKEFSYADASEVDFKKEYDNRTYKAAMEELEKSLGKLMNSRLQNSIMSELIAIIDQIGEKEGMYSLFLCETLPLLSIKKEEDSIEEVLNLVQLSDKKTSHLRKIVGLV